MSFKKALKLSILTFNFQWEKMCDSSAPGFNLVLVLVQDLLVKSLLKVTTPLEDFGCCIQHIYIKKRKG